MKQSSIDFLLDRFGGVIGDMNTTNEQDLMLMEVIKQAKAMHKEEIANAFSCGDYCLQEQEARMFAQVYYDETFNNK